MEEALASLPSDLNETYRRRIASIPAKLKHDAIRLLQFLVHSKRTLKLAEAKEIIATQIENASPGFDIKRRLFYETSVLDYCPGLVTVVHTTHEELHLAHFSVKEFLLGESQFSITTASIAITKTCLTYLTDINGSHGDIKQDFPMARYAAESWASHAVLAQSSDDIAQMTVKFLGEEVTFQWWIHLSDPDWAWNPDPCRLQDSRLYYACVVGLVAPARDFVSKGADINREGGSYGNALQAASHHDHQEIFELLLDEGADFNVRKRFLYRRFLAINLLDKLKDVHQRAVQLLLDEEADANARRRLYTSAALAALKETHQDIVELLQMRGTISSTPSSMCSSSRASSSMDCESAGLDE